jgi:hypothetical protein
MHGLYMPMHCFDRVIQKSMLSHRQFFKLASHLFGLSAFL